MAVLIFAKCLVDKPFDNEELIKVLQVKAGLQQHLVLVVRNW